jgi:hypothetical protein
LLLSYGDVEEAIKLTVNYFEKRGADPVIGRDFDNILSWIVESHRTEHFRRELIKPLLDLEGIYSCSTCLPTYFAKVGRWDDFNACMSAHNSGMLFERRIAVLCKFYEGDPSFKLRPEYLKIKASIAQSGNVLFGLIHPLPSLIRYLSSVGEFSEAVDCMEKCYGRGIGRFDHKCIEEMLIKMLQDRSVSNASFFQVFQRMRTVFPNHPFKEVASCLSKKMHA